MTRRVSVWLGALCSAADQAVFRRAAQRAGGEVYRVNDGQELVELGHQLEGGEPIDRLVIVGHGGTTWLLHSRRGVTMRPRATHRRQVSVYDVARAWAPSMADGALISLAACLCLRSPRWWLRGQLGRVVSAWGRRGYMPGGRASIGNRLHAAFHWRGSRVAIHGHRAAGHATRLAILARIDGTVGTRCEPLFQLALPEVEPTRAARRRWVDLVTGELAERWLLGDRGVEGEIRGRW